MKNLRALLFAGGPVVAFGLVLAIQSFYMTGCSASPTPAGSDCTSDTECTGDATCIDGKCATESGSSGSGGSGGSGSSSSGSSGSSGSSSSGNVVIPPACYFACTTPGDCADPSNLPIVDADNYECNAGACEYKGCNSNQECTDTYMNPNYVCRSIGLSSIKVCAQTCSSAMDCTNGAAGGAYDADNWNCNSGACEYKGCNTTQECDETFMNTDYECALAANATFKTCIHKCAAAADCSFGVMNPLNGEDNYECNAGLCHYKGCNSNQECIDVYGKPNVLCK